MEPSIAQLRAKLADLQRRRGAPSLETTACHHDLACALHETGHLDEAEAHFVAAYEGFRREMGANHLFTLTCLNNFALLLRDAGRLSEAARYLQVVVTTRAQLLGRGNPLTVNARNNLIGVEADLGEYDGAVTDYQVLLADCEQVFGPQHGNTEAIRGNLLALLWKLGRAADAGRLVDAVDGPLPVAQVLRGCARVMRYMGMCPVSLTASRFGAGMAVGTHRGARVGAREGERFHDTEWRVYGRVVGPDNADRPYRPDTDRSGEADAVADALGVVAGHLLSAEARLGELLRVRVTMDHGNPEPVNGYPGISIDRRRMPHRDRLQHDRLVKEAWGERVTFAGGGGRYLSRTGFTTVVPGVAPLVISTELGVQGTPEPHEFEA